VRADVLRATFDPPRVWFNLDALGHDVATRYWRTFGYTGLRGDFAHVITAAKGLLGAGRYAATIDTLALYARRMNATTATQAAELVARACEGLLASEFDVRAGTGGGALSG